MKTLEEEIKEYNSKNDKSLMTLVCFKKPPTILGYINREAKNKWGEASHFAKIIKDFGGCDLWLIIKT
jgi:uncharacterized membrane protein